MEFFYIGQLILINNEVFQIVNNWPLTQMVELKHIKSGKSLTMTYGILKSITKEVASDDQQRKI